MGIQSRLAVFTHQFVTDATEKVLLVVEEIGRMRASDFWLYYEVFL